MDNHKVESIVDSLFHLIPLFKNNIMKLEVREEDKDLSPIHFHILFLLDDLGQLPMFEISRNTNVTKSNLTPIIQKLIDRGLIERVRDEKDRRVLNIDISKEGREFIEGYKDTIVKNLKTKMQNLSEDDLAKLASSLFEATTILKTI